MIKENKKEMFLILSGLLLLAGWFYWFQYKPAKIKQECSWVFRYEPAKPAQEGKTRDEVIAGLSRIKDNIFSKIELESAKPIPSKGPEPARSWYEKATADEYTFCLHDHGL